MGRGEGAAGRFDAPVGHMAWLAFNLTPRLSLLDWLALPHFEPGPLALDDVAARGHVIHMA